MNTLLYPPSIDWELTPICNHNCIHCYNFWRGIGAQKSDLPSEEYYISIANKIVESHPVSVQITGGEPLIVWGSVKKAIQILIEKGINVSINTNATLVTDEIADFLSRNNMDAFVSFPCLEKNIFDQIVHCKGAFERAENGINILLKHDVRVSLNMVVTKINFPYVYETGLYVKKQFGAHYFSATKASFPQNAAKEFKDKILDINEFNSMLKALIKLKKETGMRVDSAWVYSMCGFENQELLDQFGFHRKCGCGRYNFVIDSNGNMKACGCDSKVYGNVLEESFEHAILRMHEWHTGVLLPDKCKFCINLKYCGGGCRSDARSITGTECGMDSTANPVHKLGKARGEKKVNNLPDNLGLKLNPNVEVVTERCGIRLSVSTNYAFVTHEFYEYMQDNAGVTLELIRKNTRICENDLNTDVYTLLKKGILVATDAKNESALEHVNPFSIMVIPYIETDSIRTIKDYVCDLNVRYSEKG